MLPFRKVPLAKNLTDKRREGGRGEYQDFSSKNFFLTKPKISVGKHLVFR